jgi:GNAT superfamily N-acetyltransferase
MLLLEYRTMASRPINNLDIRQMVERDMPPVLALIGLLGESLIREAETQFVQELAQASNETIRLVATLGDLIIGTMGCGPGPIPSPHVVWADWIVVDRNHRRLSVASSMYAVIERHALALGKSTICLDMGNIERQRDAYDFHTRNGFQIVGVVPDYWGPSEHLNIMAKRLVRTRS